MKLEKKLAGDVLVFRIQEERLDGNVAPDLKAELLVAVRNGHHKILLDLSEVTYADSSGLGALLFGQRQARSAGGALKVYGASGRIANLIRIARLESVLENYDDWQEALRSFEDDDDSNGD